MYMHTQCQNHSKKVITFILKCQSKCNHSFSKSQDVPVRRDVPQQRSRGPQL